MNIQASSQPQDSYVNDYHPPAGVVRSAAASSAAQPDSQAGGATQTQLDNPPPPSATAPAEAEALEDQNIFALLGVAGGSEQEKEAFLDELQQVIWEDFLENDLELLVTDDERAKVKAILAESSKNEMQKQEAVLTYLESLIPDLEEIMMEKALELKEEMVKERIAGLREFHAGQSDQLVKIDQAEQLIREEKWASASKLLNSLQ